VSLQCVRVGPLFDENKCAVGFMQCLELAARFIVDCFDGALAHVPHGVHRLGLGDHGCYDDNGHG
jgi:hypothetical protein